MKPIYLVLKPQWYDMIEDGIKEDEYRDITAHYVSRLFLERKCVGSNEFQCIKRLQATYLANHVDMLKFQLDTGMLKPKSDSVTFQRAYPKNPPRQTLSVPSITIGCGKEEWGAKKGKEYFVIHLKRTHSSEIV